MINDILQSNIDKFKALDPNVNLRHFETFSIVYVGYDGIFLYSTGQICYCKNGGNIFNLNINQVLKEYKKEVMFGNFK